MPLRRWGNNIHDHLEVRLPKVLQSSVVPMYVLLRLVVIELQANYGSQTSVLPLDVVSAVGE